MRQQLSIICIAIAVIFAIHVLPIGVVVAQEPSLEDRVTTLEWRAEHMQRQFDRYVQNTDLLLQLHADTIEAQGDVIRRLCRRFDISRCRV